MAQPNPDDVIAELRCELARTRVKLRAAQGRELAQREALTPFALAWPLLRERVKLSQPKGLLSRQDMEQVALETFHVIAIQGTTHRVHIALTGQHLKDAFEAIGTTTQEPGR